MDIDLALITLRDYVCSRCWGHLDRLPLPNSSWAVVCLKCDPDGSLEIVYVTKAYAERRRAESLAEKQEVTALLENIGVMEKPKRRSTNEILKELGF